MTKQDISVLERHVEALSQCRKGKATESVLMRFNEQEFYLLNLAARLAVRKGYASRQAWMREAIREAMKAELEQDDEIRPLIEALLNDDGEAIAP